MEIKDIDKNFNIETKIEEKDLKFISVLEKPFDLYGYCNGEKSFRRLPAAVAENVNEGVEVLASNTAGVRVRFCTDSPYIAISVKYPNILKLPHMPFTGTTGFDMYSCENGKYIFEKTFVPPIDIKDGYEGIHYFGTKKMRDITINFPLYNDVSEVYIGLAESAEIGHGGKYNNEKPIVYYGSSITQGGCASRPGTSYQAIVSRDLNYDYVNLGFSGSARGEDEIIDYINSLEMSCFVLDYDHNAPDYKFLSETHEPMFKKIRARNPDLPIIIMSMPYCNTLRDVKEREEVIKATYDNAVKSGDKNVYFIDGEVLFDAFGGDSGTVDGTHPNDLGFMCMAKAVRECLEKIDIGVTV